MQALIDEACGEADEPPAPASEAQRIEKEEQPVAAEDEDSDLFRKPKDGNYVNVSEFRDLLLQANRDEAEGAQEEEEDDDSSTMTSSQLRETAERHNLNFEDLLRDAESRGIKIRDG